MTDTAKLSAEQWDNEWRYLLRCAYKIAAQSHDPSTQNGALIVDTDTLSLLSSGCNNFPIGVEESPERWERPAKYQYVEHAERRSIYRAALSGKETMRQTMVCPWAACADCARGIICAGVTKLVRHKDASDRSPDWWVDSIAVADTMLHEAGVEIIDIIGPVNSGVELLHTGVLWKP